MPHTRLNSSMQNDKIQAVNFVTAWVWEFGESEK